MNVSPSRMKDKNSHHSEEMLMLAEIRNMLVGQINTSLTTEPIAEEDAKKYLDESYKLLSEHGPGNLQNSPRTKTKILEASQLLQSESDMIKYYVRDKIEAKVFGNRVNSEEERTMFDSLLSERDQLENKLLEEKLAEQKQIESMIESTRKYRAYNVKEPIPLLKLESLLHREKVDYDTQVQPERKLKSEKNHLFSEYLNSEQKENNRDGEGFDTEILQKINEKQENKTKQQQKNNVKMVGNYIEIVGESEDEFTNREYKVHVTEGLETVLKRSKVFFECFKNFLEKQVRRIEVEEQITKEEESILQNSHKPKRKFVFPNKLYENVMANSENFTVSELTKLFKFKPFLDSKVVPMSATSIQTSTHIISKRIGSSHKFHTKKCHILDNKLFYNDESKEDDDEKNSKEIELTIAPVEITTEKKEQGSLFQSKVQETEIATVKGTKRDLSFEIGFGEGAQLVAEINYHSLRRLHHMSSLLAGKINRNMEKFIETEHNVLDLSGNYIRPEEEYPNSSYRGCFLTLITSLFPKRKNLKTINLSKSKLTFLELNFLFKECEKYIESIKHLNISHTKLDKEPLKNILTFLAKQNSNNLIIDFSYCQISDSILNSVAPLFVALSSQVEVLNLEGNEITKDGIGTLKMFLEQKDNKLKTLILNSCSLMSPTVLSQLLVPQCQLRQISANNCRINFNHLEEVEMLMNKCKEIGLKNLEIRKNVFYGGLMWLEDIPPGLTIKVDLGSISRGGIQSKFLKIAILDEK